MASKNDDSPKKRRGGGRKAAVLFCLAATVALAFTLIRLSMGPRDKLARFVPADAVVYVHAQGRRAVADVSGAATFVPKSSADEMGLFALKTDGELTWTAALLWNRLTPPREDEAAALADAGAIQVAPTFYLLRAGDGPVILAEGQNRSIIDDANSGRALAAMRSVSRVQAYIDTDELLADFLDSEMFPAKTGKMVLALAIKDGSPAALAVSLNEAARQPRFLGFKLPSVKTTPAVPEPLFPGGDGPTVSLATVKNHLKPLLLLHEIETLRTEFGTPESAQLESAHAALAEIFSGPISLMTNPDSQTFAAYLPGIEASRLKNEILAYLSASFPKKTKTTLPDGRAIDEFVIEPGFYDLGAKEPESPRRAYPVSVFRDGALIASEQDTLNRVLAAASEGLKPGKCLPGNWPTLTISDLQKLIPKNENLKTFCRLIGLENIIIHKIGDNSLFFCGY